MYNERMNNNFHDFTTVHIKSGNGGAGAVSFFTNRKGPCGGKGGNGGNIIIQGDTSINNLEYFRYKKHFFAENGENGKSNNTTGKNGENLIIKVPIGTQCDWNGEQLYVMNTDPVIILTGGRGGLGNGSFKSSLNQIPRFSQPGEPGHQYKMTLELKLLGTIGLIGAPNAGKSTLINALTNAKSVSGEYAFTTIRPVQGMCGKVCMVDLPGIIENAHIGRGLGLQFLRHAENCKYLFMIVDIQNEPHNVIKMLQNEITSYFNTNQKVVYLILNKCEDEITNTIKLMFVNQYKSQFKRIFFVSAFFNIGIQHLYNHIQNIF